MKKILSVFLCAVIISVSLFTVAFAGGEREYSDYPFIVVPGYGGSPLYRIDEKTGEQIQCWGIQADEIIFAVLRRIVDLGIGIGKLTQGNAEYIAKTVGEEFINLYGDLACNDDGTSTYDLHRYHTSAEECCDAYLLGTDDKCRFEPEILGDYAQKIGSENIFHFACDFRMGALECARELDEFIQSVKEYTGKDKVNIFAVSHGGQVTGTYLSVYGQKGDVHNAVLTIPALGGAVLAYDVFKNDIHFDEEELLRFVEYGMMFETDINWLLKANQLGFLDNVLNAFVPYIMEVMGNWGSMWDFVPYDNYEEIKDMYLDETENAQLIAASDRLHYDIMPNYAENFKKAEKAGAHISIIAGYGLPSVIGTQETSDAIISLNSSTGAYVAPNLQRFSDGYVQKVNTGLYQVSPDMSVDASCGYLPRHTWYVEGLFHGMTYKDNFTKDLLETLVLTDEIKDVTSNKDYPQFHANTSPSSAVWAAFDKSAEGIVSSSDKTLKIMNTTTKSDLKILSVKSDTGLKFELDGIVSVAPGECVEIPVSGTLCSGSLIKKEVTIDYFLTKNVTPVGERTLSFTVMNGENAEYDEENPFTQRMADSLTQKYLPENVNSILVKTGTAQLVSMITNIVVSFVEYVFGLLTAKLG